MHQLTFAFHHDELSLRSCLEKASGRNVSIVITDNSTSMLSMKKRGDSVSMRIHRMFLSAGREVLDEIAGYIKNSKTKTPHVRAFINQNTHLLKRKQRAISAKTQGSCYNLLDLFHAVNREYFARSVSASITWGSRGPWKAAAGRTLGSYCADNNMIRINPILDNRRVPRYFLEFIVYHEMLHADIGIKTDGARRSVHSKEFKRREKMFRHYDRAITWEKKRW
jgi:hypothetical protein